MENLLPVALEHIKKLLRDDPVPPLEGDLAGLPELREIHDELKGFRELLDAMSQGYLGANIKGEGAITNSLKIFQSQMEAMLQEYKKKEEVLSALTENLRVEMENRNSALKALQESESRFRHLATHDSLTGAMNRRAFIERALEELNDASRHKVPCGIMMMDIDHFKIFNDTHGHLAGDEALRHIVRVISSFSRKHDFLGRYGGEEFLFFFCHATREASLIIAERIRKALENKPILLESGPVTITASVGVALVDLEKISNFRELDKYLQVLIMNADTAMYNAKKAGRNQVFIFENES